MEILNKLKKIKQSHLRGEEAIEKEEHNFYGTFSRTKEQQEDGEYNFRF